MESGADIIRFSSTAILLKQPLLVIGTIVFVLGLLYAQFGPGEPSTGGVPWIMLVLLLLICAAGAWLLGSSEEVEVDPASRRVTQRHLFFKFETAKNEWDFSHFTGVRVAQDSSKEYSNETTPGTGGYKGTIKTTYNDTYKISLLRAATVVTLQDKKVSVPNHPLELPTDEKQDNPLPVEALARQLSKLGGWPATRRGYVLVAGDGRGASGVRVAPSASETPIAAE